MPPKRKSQPRPELAALGKAIDERIAETAGMTRESVSERSRIDVRRIGSYIRGEQNPSFTKMQQLSRGLRLSHSEFVSRVEALEKDPPES